MRLKQQNILDSAAKFLFLDTHKQHTVFNIEQEKSKLRSLLFDCIKFKIRHDNLYIEIRIFSASLVHFLTKYLLFAKKPKKNEKPFF